MEKISRIAENYCQKFPSGSATHDLSKGYNGGHFCEALRDGNVEEMITRADGRNSMILFFLAQECIEGFNPVGEDLRILRSKALWYMQEAKRD